MHSCFTGKLKNMASIMEPVRHSKVSKRWEERLGLNVEKYFFSGMLGNLLHYCIKYISEFDDITFSIILL